MAGVGKSTVGALIAQLTGRAYVDLDAEIVRREGQTLMAIFETHGESSFRELEREALHEILQRTDDPIVALGGGSLLRDSERAHTRSFGPVVYLSATPTTLASRLGESHTRPLLTDVDLMGRVESMLSARLSAYEDTDFKVVTDTQTAAETAQTVLTELVRERAA